MGNPTPQLCFTLKFYFSLRMPFVLLVLLYFLLACALSWVVFFSEGRAFVQATLQYVSNKWQSGSRKSSDKYKKTLANVSSVSDSVSDSSAQAMGWINQHKFAIGAGFLLIIVPPLAVMTLSTGVQLRGFSDDRAQMNPQVAALLQGEQLVPPSPLPPAIFIAAEVEQARPMLVSASRNWQLLDPDFVQRLLLVFKIMREKHGYEMAILEGYRSPERQDTLARMGGSVTNAKAFQSYHQFGLAADSAFLRDGKLVITEKDPWAMKGYQLYGEVAESVGLTWGGRWKMMDFGHIELRKPGVIK